MQKGVKLFFMLSFFFVLVFSFNFVVAEESSIADEMKKITNYAEEYEVGNINYVQLVVHLGAMREKMNDLLGVSMREEGGLLKQDQIQAALGEPNEFTKWVWMEGEERDIRLDEAVPSWRKNVFDGNKIRIKLEAHPSVMKKGKYADDLEDDGFDLDSEGRVLVYHLNFFTEFKSESEELDLGSKIEEITDLAEIFQLDSSRANGEKLAEESVNVERLFESIFRQGSSDCVDVMNDIFGVENKRKLQKVYSQEIELYRDDKVDAIAHLEICEDCEWNWVNLDVRLEGRFKHEESTPKGDDFEKYRGLSWSEYESKIRDVVNSIKSSLESGDYESVFSRSNELRMLNNNWNELANNVWEQMEKDFKNDEPGEEGGDIYYWLKKEQEQRAKMKDLQTDNLEKRKSFYANLFSDYEKKDSYFEQAEWEKRLIEEFRSFEDEVCDNNVDDNENGDIDCADSKCGGQFCGKLVSVGVLENESFETTSDLYCIASVCQAKDEVFVEEVEEVCGNHVCGFNESVDNCAEDCAICELNEPIECEGDVIFKGWDENGCPLESICIEGVTFCELSEDCVQPLCGVAECENNVCETTDLNECGIAECVDGEENIENCQNGERLVSAKCFDGLWRETGIECEGEKIEQLNCVACGNDCVTTNFASRASCIETTESFECVEKNGQCTVENGEIFGNECNVQSDCGGKRDVCSNGECVSLPEVIEDKDDCSVLFCGEGSDCVSGKCVYFGDDDEEKEYEEGWEDVERELEKQSEEEFKDERREDSHDENIEERDDGNYDENREEKSFDEAPNTEGTGNFILDIFGLVGGLISDLSFTGSVVDEGSSEEPPATEEPPADESPPVEESPVGEEPMQEFDSEDEERMRQDDDDRRKQDDDERKEEDKDRREDKCKDECNRKCNDEIIMMCVSQCVFGNDGEEKEIEVCEAQCREEKSDEIGKCEDGCYDNCLKDDWDAIESGFEDRRKENQPMEQVGVFQMGGGCRSERQETNAHLYFGGWGEPFQKLEPLKQKYYGGGDSDWCRRDLANLVQQRKEFEEGFDNDFAVWFFETYLPSSASDWEQASSGMFELYWNNVDGQRELAYRMECVGINDVEELTDIELINIKYDTSYGTLEYWEELKEVKMPGAEEKVRIITPYMKFWIFPSKEFLEYDMQQAMEDHEFPGSAEDKRGRAAEGGLTDEERGRLRENDGLMERVRRLAGEYDGNLDAAVQFKDFESDEIVFNLFVQINEEDVILMTPMLSEETPTVDVTMEIDFNKIYDFMHSNEIEMKDIHVESPPWAEKGPGAVGFVKGAVNGVKNYFRMNDLVGSIKVTPSSESGDMKSLFKTLMKTMGDGDDRHDEMEEEGESSKEKAGFEDIDDKGQRN